ncbi:hypothetical protein OUZ56_026962 [Daphnia magna]|uniref:Uncharacterized protein n=1 Tax=Daphnia magna TaxID=35525 RepID=A0ABQ9ZPQ0_9CRUS|nr:hypothetical protein OUZ56_026962 [Daphnia magna]
MHALGLVDCIMLDPVIEFRHFGVNTRSIVLNATVTVPQLTRPIRGKLPSCASHTSRPPPSYCFTKPSGVFLLFKRRI